MELGAAEHVTVDGGQAIWANVVVPLVQGGQLYQGQYPLLCSDRYIIVEEGAAPRRGARDHRVRPRLHRHGQRSGALRSRDPRALGRDDPRADPRDPGGARQRARLRAGVPRGARLHGARQDLEVQHQRQRARRDDLGLGDRSLRRPGRRRTRFARAPSAWPKAPLQRSSASSAACSPTSTARRSPAPRCWRASTRPSARTASAAASTPATPPSGSRGGSSSSARGSSR